MSVYAVELLDPIATYTACSQCSNAHWHAFWDATQPKQNPPEPRTPWVDDARGFTADGEDGG
jgi:hypothetical protein